LRLVEYGVDTLICGAVSTELLQELKSREIRVIAFVSGEADSVIDAFVAGDLPNERFSMPGCIQQRGEPVPTRHR